MKQNNFGVTNIKRGLTVVAGLVKTTFSIDADGDGRIDAGEKIGFATALLPQIFPVFSLYPNITDEVKDKITEEEWDELVAHTQTLDFLPEGKEVAEQYVKRLFNWINYNRKFIADSIKLFSKKEAVLIKLPKKARKIKLAA